MNWFIGICLLALLLLTFFLFIARSGRKLRTGSRKTLPAKTAYLSWFERGVKKQEEVKCPFYFGSHIQSNVVLEQAKKYEACIFHRGNRFAIQTFDGAGDLKVNGEETVATFLADGDNLEIAGSRFTFRCS